MFSLTADHDLAGCRNHGCVNRFDPSLEGWNAECDPCAARAAEHLDGLHALQDSAAVGCSLCQTAPFDAVPALAAAA